MKNKKLITVAMAVAASMLMTGTAMAGSWQKNETGWWYDNGNGTWPANTWQWIDGNGDGIAESYHFDKNGYLSVNTTVDGYPVNTDGAWTVNGAVQTQSTNPAPAQKASDELTEAERQSLQDQMYQIICKNSGVDRGYTVELHEGLRNKAQKYAEEISNQIWYQSENGIWITDELRSTKYKGEISDPTTGGLTTGRTTGSPMDMWNEWTRMNKIFRSKLFNDNADFEFSDCTIGIGVVRKSDV